MSKTGLRTKLAMARRTKRRVDMQNRQLGLRNRILTERVAELEAQVEDERRWREDAEQAVQEKDSMFTQEWARAQQFEYFWHWAEHGVSRGWCSEPVCATHDGIPSTPEEQAEWDEGHDPCEHVLRLWPDET